MSSAPTLAQKVSNIKHVSSLDQLWEVTNTCLCLDACSACCYLSHQRPSGWIPCQRHYKYATISLTKNTLKHLVQIVH